MVNREKLDCAIDFGAGMAQATAALESTMLLDEPCGDPVDRWLIADTRTSILDYGKTGHARALAA